MTTWLVTGGSGFLGRAVLSELEDAGESVAALGRTRPAGWPVERFARADLDDPIGLARAIATIAPDVVIHAAGKTPPASAHALYLANVRATMFLLEALKAEGRPCRVVLAGSAAELGPVPVDRLPASEALECRPTDAYGLSKWAASRLGLMQEGPLSVTVGRLFNPIGPGMPASQAFGRFASVLASTIPGVEPLRMSVGDLSPRRDFVDVRDAARALILLGRSGHVGSIYHIGAGRSRPVRDGLRELIRLSGRSVEIDEGPASRGPADSVADIRRIGEHVGWSPRIPFETSLADLWAEAIRATTVRRVA